MSDHHHNHSHSHEQRTRWVVYLTAVTMVVEIFFGYWTNSMALLAEGWHTASHVFALGITWIAYASVRKYSNHEIFFFNQKKVLALSGFASAVVLQIVALLMAFESAQRLLHPLPIIFAEAIFVAVIGLIVHGISALLLRHNHENHDHNIRSAYLHMLADTLTCLTAIVALLFGMLYNLYWLDSVSGIICSFVITKWAIELIRSSGKELIEFGKKNKN